MGKFKIAEVQLSDIKLVKKNAHFMQQDTFNALVNNIRRDGQLSSVPFCVKHSDGSYTVVHISKLLQDLSLCKPGTA